MKRIFKYPLAVQSQQFVRLPEGARVLSAGMDPLGVLCLWVLVDESARLLDFPVLCVGTGHDLEERILEGVAFVDTVKMSPYIWHIFVSKGCAA